MISFSGKHLEIFFSGQKEDRNLNFFFKNQEFAQRLQQSSFNECFGKIKSKTTRKNCRNLVKSGFWPIFWDKNSF
jgi:hypothetical protein